MSQNKQLMRWKLKAIKDVLFAIAISIFIMSFLLLIYLCFNRIDALSVIDIFQYNKTRMILTLISTLSAIFVVLIAIIKGELK